MRGTPTFQSLSRPITVAGGERKPVALVFGCGMVLLVPAWFLHSIYAALGAAFLLAVGLPALRIMAKRDPQMTEVAQQYYEFKPFYPARTSVIVKRRG